MPDHTSNKLIAKNTVLLYFRTLLILFVSIYTSRVVLNTLGVEDYGIYQAVGGVIAMFTVISGALSSAISRFITFELGHGDKEKLQKIFSTSINIQLLISLIIIILAESIGIWFLNCKMNIPPERLVAANWVFQCSLLVFVIGLLSTPYNACIIAHEHMHAFAYISILEAVLKLIIVYLLLVSSYDKLISYAILLVIVSLIIRILYGLYCKHHFEEATYHFINDKSIFKEMAQFSGWSFLTNASYVFNTQGITILANMFFGVAVNAARGLATQVDAAVLQFINNFSIALNPQITKSYAANDHERTFYLICKGAKFSFYLLLLFMLPLVFETDIILKIWLKNVPEHTSIFVKLALIASIATVIGNTGYTACAATGNLKKYVIVLSSIGVLAFVGTWIAYALGCSPESTYIVFAIVYFVIDIVRLYLMKQLIDFPPKLFYKEVLLPIFLVSCTSIICPFLIVYFMPTSIYRLIISIFVCLISSCISIYFLGLTHGEKLFITHKIFKR